MDHVAVFVEDAAHCVDASLLAEAVDSVLVAPAAVHVSVTAVGDTRSLDIRVGRGGRVAWAKRFDLVAADCPQAPEAIAGSIRAGLGDLPGWLRGGEARSSWGIDVPLTITLGMGEPVEARFGVGGRALADVGPGRLILGVAAEVGTPFPAADGVASVAEAAAELGWGVEPASGRWSLLGGMRAGPALSWGSGFVQDEMGVAPVAALWLSCGYRPTPSWLLAAGLRANIVRLAATSGRVTGPGGTVVPEPWVRLDLSVSPRFRKRVRARVGA